LGDSEGLFGSGVGFGALRLALSEKLERESGKVSEHLPMKVPEHGIFFWNSSFFFLEES
jgi:hypothetical protein